MFESGEVQMATWDPDALWKGLLCCLILGAGKPWSLHLYHGLTSNAQCLSQSAKHSSKTQARDMTWRASKG